MTLEINRVCILRKSYYKTVVSIRRRTGYLFLQLYFLIGILTTNIFL